MSKLVLFRLADRADESGICYPSQRRLADECGISERTVRNAIADLICRGLVVIHTPSTPQGNTTRYRLTFATPEPRSGGEPHSGEEGHSGEEPRSQKGGTTFRPPRKDVPVTPEPRSGKPSENHHSTLREPSGSETSSTPECPPDAPEPDSATNTPTAKENPATVPRKLRPRPDKVTFQDRARWNEELRYIESLIAPIKRAPVYKRKKREKELAELEHRKAELKAWLDGKEAA
jgi:hypothetical protein